MKVILILVVLFAAIGAGLYFSGALSSPSPQEMEKQIKDLANSGASWEKLVDISPPRVYFDTANNMAGRGAEQQFKKADFADRIAKKNIPTDGCLFEYHPSTDIAFMVHVGPDGTLHGTTDLPTIKTLTQPPGANLH